MDLENARPDSKGISPAEPEVTTHGRYIAEQMHIDKAQASQHIAGAVEVPQGRRILGITVFPYSHPRIQAAMLGLVLFMTVGMYNVLTFIGGAGQQTAYLSDVSNIALYTVFSVFCLVAPACLNYFGLRPTLCFGGLGYAAYAASLWCFNYTGNVPFVIFGGAWCGLSAAFLWTAEGAGLTSFASEDKKGLYISIVWSIYQVGLVIGAAIPLAQNWNAGDDNGSRVGNGTYIGLMALMLIGAALGAALYPWHKIVREDGSRVTLERQKTLAEEFRASVQVINRNRWIVFFFPMCWAVNFFGVYQNNDFNGIVFTVRARSLNAFLSGVAQVFAPWCTYLFTDKLPFGRRKRAFWALVYTFVIINAIWIGGYWGMKYTVEGLDEKERLDVFGRDYGWWCLLFVMYGFTDATYNCYAYWFIGALSNDPAELSVYAALYRLLNALCMVVGYSLDYAKYSKEFMFGASWAFLAFGMLCVLPIIKYWLKDTNMIVLPEDGAELRDEKVQFEETHVPSKE
ncbi:UNC93-like protein [Cyphellophora attinorum]|uniref:UNC93-like protein n=1 Tax=Cyphellophora attinorum TaxID=1664694 RepID=A0A0N1HNW9_9EURO|nr:UNC93-like protein [Phialophora attinorum]KPI36832.1 UNC93-like protein [Phialophora attinorum]